MSTWMMAPPTNVNVIPTPPGYVPFGRAEVGMARRAPNPERPTNPVTGKPGSDGAPSRRAPFSDNPTIGARGLRTQMQILDAAVRAFDESGYDRATLDRIGQLVGCSRVTIYQYFSGKDDIFRHLARQVDRQIVASMEALEPITPDERP